MGTEFLENNYFTLEVPNELTDQLLKECGIDCIDHELLTVVSISALNFISRSTNLASQRESNIVNNYENHKSHNIQSKVKTVANRLRGVDYNNIFDKRNYIKRKKYWVKEAKKKCLRLDDLENSLPSVGINFLRPVVFLLQKNN